MVPNAAASSADAPSRDRVGPGDRLGADQRYELIERIGSGGMGAVYRARDHKLGCERAVKVLDAKYAAIPAFVERFRREAMAASRITHPNIVSVVDVAGEGERPVYLVMELLTGKTISALVRGQGRLPWAEARRYVDQIAAGLGAAHAQGVVHRDVKPGNCLVLADGQLKVLDFGIAKVTDMPAEVVALTAVGEIIGTCSYMAPEQIRGQVDKRSDIYALGVVTFRMLTGQVPFVSRDQDKVLLAHLTEPPPLPSSRAPGISEEVDTLVLRMLAKQPHQRFGSMEELREALAAIPPESGVQAPGGAAAPVPSTASGIFDEAPTRAVTQGGVTAGSEPLRPPGKGRPTINTAPAGSGALRELEERSAASSNQLTVAEVMGPSGTVALDTPVASTDAPSPRPKATVLLGEDEPARGGTVVADGPPPGPQAVRRIETEVASAPRKLEGLAAEPAPPRVTRYTKPEDAEQGGMLRGVLAAAGGVGLAIAVVVAWGLLADREGASTEPPSVAPGPA
ncbi:MAG: protein kinase, partial [Myxococcales bacterium]|nr:protein kinase [Myxococcales bacterium]